MFTTKNTHPDPLISVVNYSCIFDMNSLEVMCWQSHVICCYTRHEIYLREETLQITGVGEQSFITCKGKHNVASNCKDRHYLRHNSVLLSVIVAVIT